MKNRNRDSYHFDDDDEIEDGHSVRVPMMIMDGNRVNLSDTVRFDGGQPHFVRMADTASESTIEDLESPRDLDALRDAARAARDQWIERMCDAWRTPQRDAAAPDLGSRPEELMRRHLFGPDDDGAPERGEAQRERDRAWQRYRDDLQNAWKTKPRAATAVENRLERERGRGGASPTGGR
jgi:hypothetical protein